MNRFFLPTGEALTAVVEEVHAAVGDAFASFDKKNLVNTC
jgi:hypothetical protein